MKVMDNYPIGSDVLEAPWNQSENPKREIEVLVSITLSKVVKIRTSDYEIVDRGVDEDGEYEEVDYTDCDFRREVKEQITLPHEAYKLLQDSESKKDLEGWVVDDFEVILE